MNLRRSFKDRRLYRRLSYNKKESSHNSRRQKSQDEYLKNVSDESGNIIYLKTDYNLSDMNELNEGGEGRILEHCPLLVFKEFPVGSANGQWVEELFQYKNTLYAPLTKYATTPLSILYDGEGEGPIGYVMENLSSWNTFEDLLDADSEDVDLKTLAIIFIKLRKAIKEIHRQGFIICDLSPKNIMLTVDDERGLLLKIVDVDSWAIHRPDLGLSYAPSATTEVIEHPEQIWSTVHNQKKDYKYKQEYDWWVYTLHMFVALCHVEPFQDGEFNLDGKVIPKSMSERIMERLTVCSSNIKVENKFHINDMHTISRNLLDTMDAFLTSKMKGEFPKDPLYDLYENLVKCNKCGLELYNNYGFCIECCTPFS